MKNSYFLILSSTCVLCAVLSVGGQELQNAQSWQQLSKAASTSISSVAGNCQKSIEEAMSTCQTIIQQSQVSSQLQNTVTELAQVLQSVTADVHNQLLEVGNRLWKRLENTIKSSRSTHTTIIDDLKKILEPEIDKTDTLILSIQQFFSSNYNPTETLQEATQASQNQLQQVFNSELNQIETVIIEVLNLMDNGITVIKDVQSSLKSTGTFPQRWTEDYIKRTLTSCTQITIILQSLGIKSTDENVEHKAVATLPSTDILELESEEDSSQEQQEEGCNKIFENTRNRIFKMLVNTSENIRKTNNIKFIDSQAYKALHQYRLMFNNLSHKVNVKIIDLIHQFIKLYHVILSIMEKINQEMKQHMEDIFNDHDNVDDGDSHYDNIQKYFTETYMTKERVAKLHENIESSMKSAKSAKDVQEQIIKQLSLLTNGLVRDTDSMKGTTVYILLEMKNGVLALQNLKNKSNVTGIRYLFNYYKGTSDLAQLRKIVCIINAIKIDRLLQREIEDFVSSDHFSRWQTITKLAQHNLATENQQLVMQLNQKTSLHEVKTIATTCIANYNTLITNYSHKTRKILKRTIIKFIRMFEETIIIIKRKRIQNTNILDQIIDSERCDKTSKIPLLFKYLAKNSEVNVETISGVTVNMKSKNVKEAKKTLEHKVQQVTEIISSQLTEIETEVSSILNMITTETKNLQQLQQVIDDENYILSADKFVNLANIIELANTLSMSENITKGVGIERISSNQELETYFTNAKKRLHTVQTNVESELQKCTNLEQLQTQIQTTSRNVCEIISDTAIEMRADLYQYMAYFTQALKAYVISTNNEQLMTILEENHNNTISLSHTLQEYVQDKYSESVLHLFEQLASTWDENIETLKTSIVQSLQVTFNHVEDGMESARKESMEMVFDKLKYATDTIKELTEAGITSDIEEDKILILASANSLMKILNTSVNIDTDVLIEEAQTAISAAQESIKVEYQKAVTAISSSDDESNIATQITNTVHQFQSTYNTMRQCVKAKVEQCSSNYYELFKTLMTQFADKGTQVTAIIQEITSSNYTNQYKEDTKYKNFLSIIDSDSYKSSSAVTLMYELIQNDYSKQYAQELKNLNDEVIFSIINMEQVVNFISETYKKGTSIIQSIQEGTLQELSETDINLLSTSMLVSQTVIQIQHTVDFASAQQTINQELEAAIHILQETTEETIIQETTLRTIEKYNCISNELQDEVVQKFLKTSATFTTTFEMIMQIVRTQGNHELEIILQDIIQKKTSNLVSEKYKLLESYFNSEAFTSSLPANILYDNINKDTSVENNNHQRSIEQLKILTTEMNRNISNLNTESTFVRHNLLKGIRILQSIQSGNVKLSDEQIRILTECTLISQFLSHYNSNSINSNSVETDTLEVSEAKIIINEEYSNIIATLKTLTDEATINQVVSTGFDKYQSIYNSMQEKVKQTFLKYQTDFRTIYDKVKNDQKHQNLDNYNLLQSIQDEKNTITLSTEYNNFETYASSTMSMSYSLIKDLLEQAKQEETLLNLDVQQRNIKTFDSVTKEVIKHITKTSQVQQFVTGTLKKNIDILTDTMTNNEVLDETKKSLLIEGFNVSKVLTQCITNSQQIEQFTSNKEEEIYHKAKVYINAEYNTAMRIIQSATDETTIQNTTLKTIQNYDTTCHNMHSEMKQSFIQNSMRFTDTYKEVLETVKSQQNEQVWSLLQDIRMKKTTLLSEGYKQFEVYVSNKAFSAVDQMKYQQTMKNLNAKEENIQHLENFTTDTYQYLSKINEASRYINNTLQQSTNILNNIKTNNSIKLTQQEITTLTESIYISEIISIQFNSQYEQEEQVFIKADKDINATYENAVVTIKSTEDEVMIEQNLQTSVQSYEAIFNSLKEEVKKAISQSSSDFTANYINVSESRENKKIKNILKDIREKKVSTQKSEQYSQFKSYISSEVFTSSSLIQHSFEVLQQKDTEKIQQLEMLTSQTTQYINQTNTVWKYVAQNFLKSNKILNIIQEIENVDLSEEQIQILSESILISEKLSQSNKSNSVRSLGQQGSALVAHNPQVLNTKSKIDTECKNTVKKIEEAQNEECVNKIIEISVDHFNNMYTDTYNNVQSNICHTEESYYKKFQSTLECLKSSNSNAFTTLQEITEGETKYSSQQDQAYENFLTSINSEAFSKSSDYVKNIYNNSQYQMQEQSSDYRKSSIQKLTTLTNQVSEKLTEMDFLEKYVTEIYQKSSNILDTLLASESTKLTEEQTNILSITRQVTRRLAQHSILKSTQEINIIDVQTTINKKCKNTISSIRLMTSEEEIHQTISKTIEDLKIVYNDVQENIKTQITHNCNTFSTSFESITTEDTQFKTILQEVETRKKDVQSDKQLIKLTSYIKDFKFDIIYRNISQNTHSKQSIEFTTKKMQECSIKEIQELNTEVNHKMMEMDECKKYVSENISKGEEILKSIYKNQVDLDEEQIITLTKCIKITEIITQNIIDTNSEKNIEAEIEEKDLNFTHIENTINQDYEQTVKVIEAATDKETIMQAVNASVEHFNSIYTQTKEKVQCKITETCSSFEEVFKSTLNCSNHQCNQILQDIREDKVSYKSEKIQNLESYINSKPLKLVTEDNNMYQNIQEDSSSLEIKNQGIEQLKTITSSVTAEINKINEVTKYVTHTVHEGKTILKSIQTDENFQLSEEHEQILIENHKISKIISHMNLQDKESKNMLTKTKISEQCDAAIQLIKSTEEGNTQQIVDQEVQKYISEYDDAKQTTEQEIVESSMSFSDNFEQTVSKLNENCKEKATLNQIMNGSKQAYAIDDTEYNTFSSFIQNENSKSIEAMQSKYELIHHTETSSDIKERSIHEIQTFATEINKNINSMDETKKYVVEAEQKGNKILESLKQGESTELNEEQVQQLVKSYQVAQSVKETYKKNIDSEKISNSTNNESRFIIDTEMQEVDLNTVYKKVEQESTTTLELIRSTSDNQQIETVMQEQIHNYDKIYNHVLQNIQSKVTRCSNNFINTLQTTINHVQNTELQNTLNEITMEQICYQIDTESEFQKFISFADRKTCKALSSNDVSYENTRASESESLTELKEKSIHKIEKVSDEVKKNIHSIEHMSTYVNENFERSFKILEKVQANRNVNLCEEDLRQIARSMKIAQVLADVNTKPVYSGNSMQNEDTSTSIDKVQSLNGSTADQQIKNEFENKQEYTETIEETIYDYIEQKSLKTIITDEDADDVTIPNTKQCYSIPIQNMLITNSSKILEKVSLNELMVNWQVAESKDKSTPSACKNLSWTNEKFLNEKQTKAIIDEISSVLQMSRALIESTIQLEWEKMKLARQIHEILSSTTVCVDNIHRILQKLCWIVSKEMGKLVAKNTHIEVQLSNTLDEEFSAATEVFFSLQFCRKTDLTDIIDEKYTKLMCDTFQKSKDITVQKFDTLRSTVNTLHNNIDCLILTSLAALINENYRD